MFKMFFIIIFLAELVLTMALILKIYNLNKYVNSLNSKILISKDKIKNNFYNFRKFIKIFEEEIFKMRESIIQKRQEYALCFVKNFFIYGGIFFLRGELAKISKIFMAYDIGKEIYEGIIES